MLFAVRMTVSIICVVTMAMYLVCIGTDFWQSTRYNNSLQFRSAIEGTHHGLWNGCYIQNRREFCGHIHHETREFIRNTILRHGMTSRKGGKNKNKQFITNIVLVSWYIVFVFRL